MVSVVVVFDLHQLPLSYLYRKLSNYLILSAMVSITSNARIYNIMIQYVPPDGVVGGKGGGVWGLDFG